MLRTLGRTSEPEALRTEPRYRFETSSHHLLSTGQVRSATTHVHAPRLRSSFEPTESRSSRPHVSLLEGSHCCVREGVHQNHKCPVPNPDTDSRPHPITSPRQVRSTTRHLHASRLRSSSFEPADRVLPGAPYISACREPLLRTLGRTSEPQVPRIEPRHRFETSSHHLPSTGQARTGAVEAGGCPDATGWWSAGGTGRLSCCGGQEEVSARCH